MKVLLVALLFVAVASALPAPGLLGDDQTGEPSQKRWIDDFTKVFTGATQQGSKSPEKATTGPQVFDFKYGYELIQGLLAKMLQAKPIVDSIQESDKYGNDGSRHDAFGTAVVKGSEAISKMINAAFEVPKLAAKMVSNSITQALNGLGAKLIGLRR